MNNFESFSKILIFLFHFIDSYYISFNNENTTLSNFSFGSCYKYRYRNKMFKTIIKNNPQLWIWSGDVVYVSKSREAENMFNNTKNDKYYMRIREKIPTIGTWDDHDFGQNDGNRKYKKKNFYKNLFLNFIDEPSNSIRR